MNNDIVIEEIAIIGMAGRFPGAKNIDEYWQNLCNGVESIVGVTEEDLRSANVDPELTKDSVYVRACAPLDDVDRFDASFFGYTPREIEVMDPQHRIFLECAWNALEQAGYDAERYDGNVGVFGGVAFNSYLVNNIVSNPEFGEAVDGYLTLLGNEKDYPATRVSYKLNLKGPSINVQTACSSSGVAVHLACQSLLSGESDIAIAGGCRVIVPARAGYLYIEGGPLSPDGKVRPFDADANGMVRGSGAGFVVLKRLGNALENGDDIHAVIKSTAINNDGSDKVGFTAPSIHGQANVISDAIALAGIDAETIKYIETHGTGTKLGDPIEISALTKAFREYTDAKNFCAIGSVKANIGHLDAGACVAGIIKTVLALKHKVIPPSLNFYNPNPHIDFHNSPFFVNTKLAEWKTDGNPRRAGISAFGMGGTNAHVILEEAPAVEKASQSRPRQLFTVSAKTETALNTMTKELGEYLRNNKDICLEDAAYTLHIGRKEFSHRRVFVCEDRNDAISLMSNNDNKRVLSGEIHQNIPSIVFMFPGQGAQHVNMGLDLYNNEKIFKENIDTCAEILKPLLGVDLRTVLYPESSQENEAAKQLKQTGITQPALFVIEYALAKLWKKWGIQPEAMIGHSVGEYVAACLSNVFTLEDALFILAARASLIQEMPAGSMRAVRLTENEITPFLSDEVALAACNSPKTCVVSGTTQAVEKFDRIMSEQGLQTIELHTSHAFHSHMMEPVQEKLVKKFADIRVNDPQIPFVSCLTGTWITNEEAKDPSYWAKQLRHKVQFSNGILELQKTAGRVFIEVGPGTTLYTAALQHPKGQTERTVIASLHHAAQSKPTLTCMLEALGRVWLTGCWRGWESFHDKERRRRVALPSYPFEKKRYWIDPPQLPSKGIMFDNQNEVISYFDKAAPPLSEPVINEEITQESIKNRVLNDLKTLMYDLSGIEFTETDFSTSFIEMGLDSLFLTQISSKLKKQFGITIKFRQLFEEVPTLDSLSGFIIRQMPEEKLQKEPVQLDLSGVNYKSAVTSRSLEKGLEKTEGIKQDTNEESAQDSTKTFGAAARIEKTSSSPLLPEHRIYLDVFTKKYSKKTEGSKKFAQENRSIHADPRVVSGFNPIIKELVYPIVVNRSLGSKVWDIDDNEYVDMTNSFGANLFGYSPPFVVEAIKEQLKKGFEIGPQHPLVGEVANLLCQLTGLDRAAFCNTGSEAVLGAMRIARTVTGRDTIAIFSGAYHGINDEVIVRGTKSLRSIPAAAGILPSAVQNVLVLEYGNPESIEILVDRIDDLAAIMVEPVQSRNLNLQPREFLKELRRITDSAETALIFDEVITGFRSHVGGAQAYFGAKADLATYGKVIGGGLSIGVIAGKTEYMDALDGGFWNYGDFSVPEVGVTYFAGTFVRHPLALAAAKASLEYLKRKGPQLQESLNEKMAECVKELREFIENENVPISISHFSSSFRVNFENEHPCNGLFYCLMKYKGVHILDGFTWFLTTSHTDEDIAFVVNVFKESILEMKENGLLKSSSEPSSEVSQQQQSMQPGRAADQPPVPGARLGKDANGNPAWYIIDPERPGKYLQIEGLR